MLAEIGQFNALPVDLRSSLESKVRGFGKRVDYRFDISHSDPDPEKRHLNAVIWPSLWTLGPRTFRITVKEDKKTRSVNIGLVESMNVNENNKTEYKFKRIRITEKQKGVLSLDLDNPDEFEMAMYLELHPKQKGGAYADRKQRQVFERIDIAKLSKENREARSEKLKAQLAAQEMSDAQIQEFADAMNWPAAEIDVLRGQVEEVAEFTPKMFNDLVSDKRMGYQAEVKRAIDKQIIGYDPVVGKWTWANDQVIVILGQPMDERTHIEIFAEWLMTNGEKASDIFEKIKSLQTATA